ncbi:MAG TPA: hypothetical protein V6D11_29580 [Waterburya sp.]|jgi:hypothetical protein
MKRPNGHIKLWEWARLKRWFLSGDSYTTLARRSGRSRSVIALHAKQHRWQEQRNAIRLIGRTAGIRQTIRYLESCESVLLEYVERLNVAKTLEQVQQSISDLSE